MKLSFLFLFIFIFNADPSFSQSGIIENEQLPKFSLGISGGSSFNNSSTPGFASNLSLNFSLSRHFDLSLAVGYFTSFKDPRDRETMMRLTENNERITTKLYEDQLKYQYIPFEFRGRYNFNRGGINPYISLNIGTYVFLDNYDPDVLYITKNETTGQVYESKIIKRSEVIPLPSNVLQLGLGAGIIYPLTEKISLDLAYLFQGSSTISNTNNILAGIIFNL